MARWVFSRWRSSQILATPLRTGAISARAIAARAALSAVRAGQELRPAASSQPQAAGSRSQPAHAAGGSVGALLRCLGAHGWLVALVLMIIAGESMGRWSLQLTSRAGHALRELPPAGQTSADSAGQIVLTHLAARSQVPRAIALRPGASQDPVVPLQSAPREITDAFREIHLLSRGETLGALADRYRVSIASIVWANGLEAGDALMVGQPLRIPRVSGAAHRVVDGETVAEIAGGLGVAPEAILAFGPNHLQDGREPAPGVEIFVPGGELPLPDVILGRGGLAYLAAREAEAAGVVLEDETNLRDGPGTDYGQQVQLDRGRQVALRARHADWLKVEVAGAAGWVRADLLAISAGLVEALPETDDFPPPPPRWVWPAWGTLTSGFGARWGAFHNGIDIANGAWTPIRAARAGQVIEAGWCRGYGYCVKIRHGGGVETIYGHMVTRPSVATGDDVAAGQRIGSMGSTYDRAGGGYSTGVHLHFTVIVNGRAVNPLTFLP